MDIKKFIAISVVIHLIILSGVYFLPEPQKKKTKEFITSLVTPEEMRRPEIAAPPAPKPTPVPPPVVQKPRPAPRRQPMTPVPPRTMPTPDRPVVPDMGKEEGKPLPEGVTPKPGKGGGKEGAPGELSDKPGYEESRTPPGLPRTTREKLFDKGVIGRAAEKGPGGSTMARKDDAITFDTKEYRFAGYMRKLKEKIESIWDYPAEARKRGIYGDLRIRFTIGKDGRLRSIQLERTSGYKALDDAAIKALKDGEPYWPLPDEWGMDTYTVNGHFIYTLYGYGLR